MPRYTLTVNGKRHEIESRLTTSLLDVLRENLDLTGAKPGCGEGQCGACTVLLNGTPTRACVTKAADVGEASIETIEGLAADGKLHPIQEAFLAKAAFQCGYCTPGMILAAKALLARNPKPNREEVRRAMNGHICRCGAYTRIVDAVIAAAEGGARA
jgi:nicotinate dehydrogenase subunit A